MTQFMTLFSYEFKKIFSPRMKLLVLAAVAAFLFFASAQRYFTENPETDAWKAEHLLDGRLMDEVFFSEMREDHNPDSNGLWRYAKLFSMSIFGYNRPTSIVYSSDKEDEWTEEKFFATRERVISEYEDAFFLTKKEKNYWAELEKENTKPFIYRSTRDMLNIRETYQFTVTITCMLIAVFLAECFAGERENRTDAIVYTSKLGHGYTLAAKLAAGCAFSLVISVVMLLAAHIPVVIFSGLHGLGAPWYMVMPLSRLSIKAWKMLFMHSLVCILGCVLTGLLTMVLSLVFDRSITAAGIIVVAILLDLFGNVPTSMRLLSQIRYLTPITILLNTDIPDMRLTKLFGKYLISFQVGPVIYVLCGIILVAVAVRIFRMRYVWHRSVK